MQEVHQHQELGQQRHQERDQELHLGRAQPGVYHQELGLRQQVLIQWG